MLNWLFARAFERLYHARNQKKTCGRLLEHDTFDGESFTIDTFYERYRQFFDHPDGFYLPPASLDELGFREGLHPRERLVEERGAAQRRETSPERSRGPWPERSRGPRRMIFDSPITSGDATNDTVPFKWFTGRRATSRVFLLFVPGWGRRSQGFEEEMCQRWADQGIDMGLITKPYHQARALEGSFTGEYFISANLFWTIANFRQCVAEIRAVLRYMRPRYDAIGLFGMSSGGFQAGLAVTCETVDFHFPFITGCQLGSITWHGLITQFVRRDLERKGVDEASLNKVWSITDLEILGRFSQARHVRHYIAKYDTVVPTKYQERLWQVYGRQSRVDLDSSHYSAYFRRHFIVDDVARFVQDRL
jgi:hypothetical protein